MSSKYIVRQPIKDQANKIIGYEIQYHGENQAFGDNGKNVRAVSYTHLMSAIPTTSLSFIQNTQLPQQEIEGTHVR